MLRDDDSLLVLVIIVFLALLPPGCGTVLVRVQIPHAVAAVLLDALALSSHFITRLVIMIISNDTDDDGDTNLVALSNNDRGFPDLTLLPLSLAALVTRLPPCPPLLDDVDELLEEIEEDHSGGGDQAQPHSSVVVTRLPVSMMITVLTMLMVGLESVGEKMEEGVPCQSANS